MSGQPSLVTLALDAEVKRPGGVMIQRQFYRDKSAQGSGVYKAMDENGNIEIIGGPGAGFIDGGGTANFITKFTPDGNTIGNSSLFDNGNIGYGTVVPNSVAAFDIVSTTKGMLFPRMTTAQRNLIVTGASTDGLFIYNISTEKFNFWNQTLGAWEQIDTATGGDVSGAGTTDFIPRWTDGPNSVLGDSIIRDNGDEAAVNRAIVVGTTFAIQGDTADATEFYLQGYNSTPTLLSSFRNDGLIVLTTPTTLQATFFENGDVRIGNALNTGLFWDVSTARVGINTDTPTSILNIQGTGNNTYIRVDTDAAHEAYIIFDQAGVNMGGFGHHNADTFTSAANALGNVLMKWYSNANNIAFPLVPIFANNAAAIVGGLVPGDVYKVLDAVTGSYFTMIVL